MIKLPKSSLEESTNVTILANTPKSLLNGLLRTVAVREMRASCTPAELLDYYKKITAKGDRSPFVAAIAYATLISLLMQAPTKEFYPDASCLRWGEMIEQLIEQRFGTTQFTVITQLMQQPVLIYTSGTGTTAVSNQKAPKVITT
jgi:hypothetical protein